MVVISGLTNSLSGTILTLAWDQDYAGLVQITKDSRPLTGLPGRPGHNILPLDINTYGIDIYTSHIFCVSGV